MSENLLSYKALEALRHIRNSVMHTGKVPTIRELMRVMNYRSPHSAVLLMKELVDQGYLKRKDGGKFQFIKDLRSGNIMRTVSIPLVGNVPCGTPMLAEENFEALIPVSIDLARPGNKYFLLRAIGDSMNLAGINNGDLMLIKQQHHADHNGQKVVVLIDDEATVKEFYDEGECIILRPRSSNQIHQPIILTRDFQIQGVVINTISNY